MGIKTLHLTNAYHPSSGGIRAFYGAMLAAANAERRPMRLIVPSVETRVEEVGAYGRIYHVAAPRSPIVDSCYRLLLPHAFLSRRGAVRRILEAEQPDLIEVCDKYSLCHVAGLLRQRWMRGVARPTLVGLSCERLDDNVTAYGGGRLGARFARWYMGHVYTGQFDYHLANSEYTARELRDSMSPALWREVHVVPMGVTVDDLGPQHRSASLRAEMARLVGARDRDASRITWLLYAGRLAREKNLSLLFDTLAQLEDAADAGDVTRTFRLIIAGNGPQEAALRREAARRLPGRVLFWGHVTDRAMLARLYASCDAFVHPNPREPFGIGPLEAMASGLPLVAPSAGGLLSYASDRNAWLVEPNAASVENAGKTGNTGNTASNAEEPSAARLAAAVRDAVVPGALRDARLSAARETAAAYGWSSVTRVIFSVYDALHARRAPINGAQPSSVREVAVKL